MSTNHSNDITLEWVNRTTCHYTVCRWTTEQLLRVLLTLGLMELARHSWSTYPSDTQYKTILNTNWICCFMPCFLELMHEKWLVYQALGTSVLPMTGHSIWAHEFKINIFLILTFFEMLCIQFSARNWRCFTPYCDTIISGNLACLLTTKNRGTYNCNLLKYHPTFKNDAFLKRTRYMQTFLNPTLCLLSEKSQPNNIWKWHRY